MTALCDAVAADALASDASFPSVVVASIIVALAEDTSEGFIAFGATGGRRCTVDSIPWLATILRSGLS